MEKRFKAITKALIMSSAASVITAIAANSVADKKNKSNSIPVKALSVGVSLLAGLVVMHNQSEKFATESELDMTREGRDEWFAKHDKTMDENWEMKQKIWDLEFSENYEEMYEFQKKQAQKYYDWYMEEKYKSWGMPYTKMYAEDGSCLSGNELEKAFLDNSIINDEVGEVDEVDDILSGVNPEKITKF